ncbi:MAG: hypothetical protein EXQ96_02545 [Alphaproteobacteria bacterium]|nr:hypothetical protein [Alphaproteobacteria bacterium]
MGQSDSLDPNKSNDTIREDYPTRLLRQIASAAATAALIFAVDPVTRVSAQEFNMKMANINPVTSPAHEGMVAWEAYIKRHARGRIKTEIFSGGVLGNFTQLVEQTRLGTIEATFTTGGGISNVLPEIQVFDIPYVVRDDRVVEVVQSDPIMLDMMRKEALAKTGMRMIGISGGGGWRSFYTRGGPVKTAADIKGVKIRTVESAMPMEHVRTLGANPAPIPWQELYTAFATRVVDGTMNSVSDVVDMNFHEYLKFGVLDRHTFVYCFWWINEAWWKKLPADLQTVLLNGFYDLQNQANNSSKWREIGLSEKFTKAGGAIHSPTEDEYKTFLPARDSVTKWYVGKYGDRWLTMMTDAIGRAEKAIEEDNQRRKM